MVRWIMGFVGCLLIATIAAAQQQIGISIQDKKVIATGLTPNQPSYWVGFGRAVRGYRPALLRWGQMVTADGSGRAELAVPNGVPPVSMWCVVDGASGAAGIFSPSDSAVKEELDQSTQRATENRGGIQYILGFDLPVTEYTLLLVRPGSAGWLGRYWDGGASDFDQVSNGNTSMRFSSNTLIAIGTQAASPTEVLPTDTVVAIDTQEFRYWIVSQVPGNQEGASR